MSSIRDKLGLVKTEIPIDEIPSHTQEISDWLRLRYLNETNQNSYVLTAFDWIEESVPQKYKLQQINTNVDISSKVEKEIIWDNISEFVNKSRGDLACNIIDSDDEISIDVVLKLEKITGVSKARLCY